TFGRRTRAAGASDEVLDISRQQALGTPALPAPLYRVKHQGPDRKVHSLRKGVRTNGETDVTPPEQSFHYLSRLRLHIVMMKDRACSKGPRAHPLVAVLPIKVVNHRSNL